MLSSTQHKLHKLLGCASIGVSYLSVASHFTGVDPVVKLDPDGGLHSTVICKSGLSMASRWGKLTSLIPKALVEL